MRLSSITAIASIAAVALTPASALANTHHHHHHKPRHHKVHHATATFHSPCAGQPTQALTVVNDAHVSVANLVRAEQATADQSLQIRAAWGTPCVTFAPGGWTVTLTASAPVQNPDGSTSTTVHGEHCGALGDPRTTCYSAQPSATVDTGQNPVSIWARGFTHEVGEMLADPTDAVQWKHGLVEIDDPVEDQTYSLDGVAVSDFAFPSYFNGGAGPYDQMGALSGPAYGV